VAICHEWRFVSEIERRLARLEAEADIRRLAARYMRLCDEPEPDEAGADFAEVFTEDAIWEGLGAKAGQEFKRVEGRNKLINWFATLRVPGHYLHKFNVHFLTSESILVDNDCSGAEGRWIMFQTTLLATGQAELRMARIVIRFRVEHGVWRIAHFTTRSLLKTEMNDQAALAIAAGIS
jgi:SnoaL-like domain